MHEEVEEKSVALCFKGGKVTTQLLAKAMLGLVRAAKRGYQKHQAKALEKPGRVSMKQLAKETGGNMSNIEITDKNIKSFDPIAREFGIRYELKKADNGHLYVFFKSANADAMTAAFKKYSKVQLQTRPSFLKELRKFAEQVRNMAPPGKTKHQQRGVEL